MNETEKRVRLSRGEVFVRDWGGDGEPILFSHGLLWSHRMFEPQAQHLRDRYRCIGYDHRGQGQSEVPREPSVSIESLTEDAIELIETSNLAPCHFVGLSMGGFVGMRLAARRPDLVRSLVLMATAADEEPAANLPRYRLLAWVTRLFGVRAVYSQILPIMFGETFLKSTGQREARQRWAPELLKNKRSVTRAVRGVFERENVTHELAQIQCPTLVLHGEEDGAISAPRSRALAERVPNSEFQSIATAGHSLTVEQPDAVNTALDAFLSRC